VTVEHELRVLPTAIAAAEAAAEVIASLLNDAVEIDPTGRAYVAFSGGSSPRPMLARLAELSGRSLGTGVATGLGWDTIDVFQVDERVAPHGSADRNLVDLQRELTDRCVPEDRLHPMPVELGAEDAAAAYAAVLDDLLGPEPVLDVVHLGIGDDGHTASLVPGDAVLTVQDRDVAATGDYRGHRRVTLTYPALDRARTVVWLVVGVGKAEALAELLSGDPTIPASQVVAQRSIIIADTAAAG
jgi:6-phosphogluconolactonase